jgi:trans-aconitate methyltransferase
VADERAVDYDRMWEEVYGDMQDLGPTHRHMTRLMRRMLTLLEYESLLEVGVGFGHNLRVLTSDRRLRRIAGIDISQHAIEHVTSEWEGEFHRLDITRQRLDQQFELVCCALVLEHIADDAAALANMHAMCSGHLLVTTIGGDFDRYRPWEEQMGHVRNYCRGELEHKLRAAGFEPVQSIRWGFPVYSPLTRTVQNRITATAKMSPASRLAARLLYAAFFLNSCRRGDLLLVLARSASPRAAD